MKNLVIILMGILLISAVSAIYAGECMEVNLSELDHSEDILYLITGNSSNLDGMNITLDSNTKNASVCFAVNYKPDTFNLVFFNEVEGEKEIVIEHHYHSSGGGSSNTIYVQNKTIEYVDKIIYKENETIDLTKKDPKTPDENILKDTSWKYWYLYVFTFGVIAGLIYLWFQHIFNEEENWLDKTRKELEKEEGNVSP